MKLDGSSRQYGEGSDDVATRLKANLRIAVNCLRDRESSGLVNHIVHEIARLVALNGERRLREQYEEIIGLSESASSESYRKGSNPSQLDPVRPDSEDDWDRIHQVNAELRDRMSTMRSTLHQIEEKRHDEVRVDGGAFAVQGAARGHGEASDNGACSEQEAEDSAGQAVVFASHVPLALLPQQP